MELAILLAITATVVGLAGRLPERSRVKRELGTAKIQRIDQLRDGTKVAIRGEVALAQSGDELVAPLTGRWCVYWLVTFDEVGVGGDYVEIGRAEQGTPFLLRGENAVARVVPDNPRVAVPGTAQMQPITALRGQPFNAMTRLAKTACKRKPNYRTSWLRATEYIVSAGMPVTVVGWCTYEPDPDAAADVSGYRSDSPTRPVISGSRSARLLIG
ncbi:MAG: hypothetical protein HOV81_04690 [Kofleriaceae bacterium]|nr:hypothetical protein [Kofleriaceae bacterium]